MNEKKPIKISLSTFFLIIAIIVIIVMGYFMYKFYNEKIIATEKATELQTQVNNLNGTVNDLQGKIDNISETINSSVTTNNSENDTNAQTNNSTYLELGNYTVNEVKTDDSGVSNEECGVELKENNNFIIYMGWGTQHSGKYEIENETLICKSTLIEWESGGYGSKNTNVIFTFKIVNKNKLELSNIDINDTNNEKLVYEDGLTIGMTYSKK